MYRGTTFSYFVTILLLCLSASLALGVAPTVTSFTPTSGPVGQAVTITGTNFTGASAVKFNGTGATFTVVNASSISTTVPAGATSGTIAVTTPGGTGTSTGSFTVIPSLQLTASILSPTAVGTPILLTATPASPANLEYKFRAKYTDPLVGSVWTTIQEYGVKATATWTPTEAHGYTIIAYARLVGNALPYQVYRELSMTVKVAVTDLQVTINPAAPTSTGTPVRISVSPVNGGTLEYRFRAKYAALAGGFTWQTLQEYSSSSVCNWTPTEAHPYILYVYAREKGKSTTYDVFKEIPYAVNTPVSALVLAASSQSPVGSGTPVKLTATATGGGTLEYKFYALYNNANNVQQTELIREYAPANYVTWYPRTTYTSVVALVREKGKNVDFEQMAEINSYLTVAPVSSLALSANPVSPSPVGVPILLTATPANGGTLEYQFKAKYLSAPGVYTWSTLQSYDAPNTCTWTPAEARVYTIYAYAREQGTTMAYKVYRELPFTVTSPISITMPPVNAPILPGGTQQFTATVTGSANTNVVYSLQEGAAGGTISNTGLYTAPAGTTGTFHIIARAQADLSKSVTREIVVSATASWRFFFDKRVGTNVTIMEMNSASGNTVISHGTMPWTFGSYSHSWSVSPNGQKVAHSSGGNIYLMNIDGTGDTKLTTDNSSYYPTFNADGTKIAFTRIVNTATPVDIWTMNIDGTSLTKITTDGVSKYSNSYNWNNSKIAYRYDAVGAATVGKVVVANSDGTNKVEITGADGNEGRPLFNKEGTKIIMDNFNVVKIDGTGRVNLSPGAPYYSPDFDAVGNILYIYWNANGISLMRMNGDGTGQTGLATVPATAINNPDRFQWLRPMPVPVINMPPSNAPVAPGGTQQFTATVTGVANTNVVYSVEEGAAGGTISATGLYTAPATIGTYHIIAKAAADLTVSVKREIVVAAPAAWRLFFDKHNGNNVTIMEMNNINGNTAITHGAMSYTFGGYGHSWSVSPDGRKVTHTLGGNIYIMNIDGTGDTQLTTDFTCSNPTFSSDGTKIVFSRITASNTPVDIWMMNTDGTNQTKVTTDGIDKRANSFNSITGKIAYDFDALAGEATVSKTTVINSNGTGKFQVSGANDNDNRPLFNKEGTKLIMNNFNVVNTDGTGRVNLNKAAPYYNPDFDVDGNILYIYWNQNGIALLRMKGDGTDSAGIATVPAAAINNPERFQWLR